MSTSDLYVPKAQNEAIIAERDIYKRAFEAALKWLDHLVREDAMWDTPKDTTFSDEYKMDLADIRAARRKLEAKR